MSLALARTKSLLATVRHAFADLPPDAKILIAVSGGPDSTALVHLLCRLPERCPMLEIGHVDHSLRPGSVDDRAFVERLAVRLGLPCHVVRVDVRALADERGRGLEDAAREARYRTLDRTARAIGARAIAIGHTVDDRAETILLRLVTGAGTAGLSGMRARRGALIRRPLLTRRRHELRDWLSAAGETFCVDASNDDLDVPRNFVRARVLPLLAHLNPRVVESLARAATLLEADDRHLSELARDVVEPLAKRTLAALPEALARRVVVDALREACGTARNLGHEHVDAVLGLARGKRAGLATDLPGGLRVVERDSRVHIVSAVRAVPTPFEHRLNIPGLTRVPERGDLTLSASRIAASEVRPGPASGDQAWIPMSALGSRPVLRSPVVGDRFRPFGAPGQRRLGRYLRERGIAAAERSSVSLLVGDAGILWVIGHQVSESVRLRPGEDAYLVAVERRKSGADGR